MFQLMRNCGLGLCLILIGCSGEGDLPALEGPDVVHGTEPTHCQAHTQFGTPTQQSDIVLCREGYVLGYSYSNKHAVFAQYHATLSSVSPKIERVTEYIVDDDILPLYQSTSDDYKYTGYDRGHLAPYASMDFSQLSADESNLCRISFR